MLYLIAVVAAAIAFCMVAAHAWPEPSNEKARTAGGTGKSAKKAPGRPETLEGVLVAQLVAGEITPGQYRLAIERLAARDDERNPLAVPPEIGPADA